MENTEDKMPCPVCNITEIKDADVLKFCKICEMNIKYGSIIVKRHNRKFYFCSDYCKNLFLKAGFRSFRLHNIHKVI